MKFENGGNGGMYTLSEFFARIFDDMEWEDMPLPVSNTELMEHFDRSVIRPFSVYCPRQEYIRFGEEARISLPQQTSTFRRYKIPMYLFPTSTCLGVSTVEPISNQGYSYEYGPIPFMGAPDAMLMAMSSIRMFSSMGASSNRSLTTRFTKPDCLDLFGGYAGVSYEAILLLTHDLTLATIPDTAFESLYELALLDTKAYFYSKLKRKDGLETGIGSITLKIEDWSNAAEERKNLLNRWHEEGFNLDIDSLHYFA